MSFYPQQPLVIDFGREICGDLAAAEAREWLVTNGIGRVCLRHDGGHAYAPVSRLAGGGSLRPGGIALSWFPKLMRWWNTTARVTRSAPIAGRAAPLIRPGIVHIERFRLEGTTPVWTFACADALLEKRIWMEHGANTTYVQYTVVRARRPVRLSAKVLVNYRGYHGLTHAPEVHMDVQPVRRRPARASLCGSAALLSPQRRSRG